MGKDIKKLFKTLARYNSITNQELISILENINVENLTKDCGSHYGSILGILNHQMLADISWLRGYSRSIQSLEFINEILSKIYVKKVPREDLYWKTLDDFKSARLEMDNLIEKVVESIPLEQYTSLLKIEGRRGKLEYITWRYLLHLFNHHTHHRGSVSLILDQLNVENDYSNLLWKV